MELVDKDTRVLSESQEEEILSVLKAIDNYYGNKKADAFDNYQQRITEDVLERGISHVKYNKKDENDPLVDAIIRFDNFSSIPLDFHLSFSVRLIWLDVSSKVYRHITGSVQVELKPKRDKAERFLEAYARRKLSNLIRKDAEWKYSRLKSQGNEFHMVLDIEQNLVNVPEPWCCEFQPSEEEAGVVRNLVIGNNNGEVSWLNDLNITEVDFSCDLVKIDSNSVECFHPVLSGQCRVTLHLPKIILTLRDKLNDYALQEKVAAMVEVHKECILQEIDWKHKQYTISIAGFGQIELEEDSEEQQEVYEQLTIAKKQLRVLSVCSAWLNE